MAKSSRGVIETAGGGAYHWVPQNCPICELPPKKYVGRRGGSAHRAGLGVECELWRCGTCGLIFPNPMPVPVGGLGQHYAVEADSYFQHHDSGKRLEGARNLVGHAAQLTGAPGRLLDIGSGRGEVLVAAREAGWRAVGIEPSPTFAQYAAERSGAEIRGETLERCGFPDGSFDACILAAVLEHLYNPNETVREIARVLRPGGALFVDVPNEKGLYFRVGNLYQRLRGRDWSVNLAPTFEPFHVFGFNQRALRLLLAKHGLRVRDFHVYGGEFKAPSGRSGLVNALERAAARVVTAISDIGDLGTYIETWAVKRTAGGG